MHALILLFLFAPETPAQPLRIFEEIPPMTIQCSAGETAAVHNDKNNVEHVACYAHLQCEDGANYGAGACVCPKGRMPVLNQDDQVSGCSAAAKKTGN